MNNENISADVTEIWVPCKFVNSKGIIEEYPMYEVSSLGKVRSKNYKRSGETKILEPYLYTISSGTYHFVYLRKANRTHNRSVHRLVLSSFNLKDYFKDDVVNHINSDPSDNRLCNLEWATQKDNVNTEHRKELMSKIHTNRNDMSKRVSVKDLTTGEITEYPSASEACRALGLNTRTVSTYINSYNGHYKRLNLLFAYA